MRTYSFVQEKNLQGDGAALSAVLFRLIDEGQKERILEFIRSLPEQDIRDLDFISTPRDEVMVQLQETFGKRTQKRDAAVLSDGTLRVLAVAAALLSVPEGSTVVIEEIDNGVHPSRAALLLENIKRAATERSLKVLLTTHNPALLDALPTECIPDVVACYRDPEEGDSRLIRLEDLGNYPELVAQGPLGRLVTQGILDRMLKDPNRENPKERVEQNLRWLQEFERSAHES
jgi:predicted ATPase